MAKYVKFLFDFRSKRFKNGAVFSGFSSRTCSSAGCKHVWSSEMCYHHLLVPTDPSRQTFHTLPVDAHHYRMVPLIGLQGELLLRFHVLWAHLLHFWRKHSLWSCCGVDAVGLNQERTMIRTEQIHTKHGFLLNTTSSPHPQGSASPTEMWAVIP